MKDMTDIYLEFKAMHQVEQRQEKLQKQEERRNQEGQFMDFQRHNDTQSRSGERTRVDGLTEQSSAENQTTTKVWGFQRTAYDPKRPKDHSDEKETSQSLYQREDTHPDKPEWQEDRGREKSL